MSLSRLLEKDDLAFQAEVDRFVAADGGAIEGRADPGATVRALVGRLAAAGILRHAVAPVAGGLPSLVKICIARERLARAHGLADLAFAMQGLGAAPIAIAGSPEQRARWLPRIASGEAIAAFAITEEDAGSDVQAMKTTAAGGRLRGEKTFISNAGIAGVYVAFAKVDGRVTAFIVDGAHVRLVRALETAAPHPIGTIAFDDAPGELLGREGGGFEIAMETLAFFRPSVGAAAAGFAARALEESLTRAQARVQFGKPIATFQAIQFYLAEMATDLDAARLLVYRAARLRDDGEPGAARASAMAKLAATELAQAIVDKAVQIHGGSGVLVGSVVERLLRDVRALRIYEGTSEIQKLVIARDLLRAER